MPPKNSVKIYLPDSIYHIYNRGVEKRYIFLDEFDYKTYLHFLKVYLDPSLKVDPYTSLPNLKSLADEIDLLAYCLMPNHFHLLVKQKNIDGITKFMKRIGTSYSIYFNKRYDRVGPLFQGIYKAVLIKTDEQLIHVSRYIHLNPFERLKVDPSLRINLFEEYSYSSYAEYLGKRETSWVKPLEVLSRLGKPEASVQDLRSKYIEFVKGEINTVPALESILIDHDAIK